MDVKVKTMHGIHTLRRDRTSQVIKCNPWSTKLHPYPSLIQKMKTYLELEERLGPKSRPQPQTTTNPVTTNPSTTKPTMTRPTKYQLQGHEIPRTQKTNVPDERRRTMIAKGMYKGRVLTQPTPSTPTSTAPTPMVATISTQTPIGRSTAESILVTLYKSATGQFAEDPGPTTKPLNENSNPPPPEDIPSAPVRQGTPWPNAGSVSDKLFETRKDWLIPLTPVPTPAPHENRRTTQNFSNPPCHGEA